MLIWAGLLALPVYDLEVGARLALFLPLPALVLLLFHLSNARRPRLALAFAGASLAAMLLMAFGEIMSLARLYPDKAAIEAELADAKARFDLGDEDFVLAPYGTGPACNWFLGTQAGLVTSLERADFERYRRVFVLNTGERPLTTDELAGGRTFLDERARYGAMRRDVPLPPGTVPAHPYRHFTLVELETAPAAWRFDDEGRWLGWAPID